MSIGSEPPSPEGPRSPEPDSAVQPESSRRLSPPVASSPAPAIPNAAPVPPVKAGTQTQNHRPDKPYKESPIRQLLPGWRYPQELKDQDRSYFDGYNRAIDEIANSPSQQGNYSPAVLAASQRVYDGESSRRESINNRCGSVLSTGGILGALFVAAGQLGLTLKKGSFGAANWLQLAVFLIALVYLGISIAMALAVQGSEQGNVVDPGNIGTGANQPNIDVYNIQLAREYLSYTVLNYEVNNRLKFQLHSAQRYLRNGIMAIIIAGMLSPLALHT